MKTISPKKELPYPLNTLKWWWFNFRCNRGWGGHTTYHGRFYMQSKTFKFKPDDSWKELVNIDFTTKETPNDKPQ